MIITLQVSGMYSDVHKLMNAGHSAVKTYVPYSWVSMVFVKHQYYQALSHYYVAMALLEQKGKP